MNKQDKQRPGVIFRFDWLSTLEKLSIEAQARFLMACLYRGRDRSYEVKTDRLDVRDAVRLETLWEHAAPAVDADGDGWADGILQRKYAAYAKQRKAADEEKISFEDWKEWYLRRQELCPNIDYSETE